MRIHNRTRNISRQRRRLSAPLLKSDSSTQTHPSSQNIQQHTTQQKTADIQILVHLSLHVATCFRVVRRRCPAPLPSSDVHAETQHSVPGTCAATTHLMTAQLCLLGATHTMCTMLSILLGDGVLPAHAASSAPQHQNGVSSAQPALTSCHLTHSTPVTRGPPQPHAPYAPSNEGKS